MTFEELLGLKVEDLENISDAELLVILAPCLDKCPPIDIQILNKEAEAIAQKKQELKNQKKSEKEKLKAEAKATKLETAKPNSKSIQTELQHMMDLIQKKQEELCQDVK